MPSLRGHFFLATILVTPSKVWILPDPKQHSNRWTQQLDFPITFDNRSDRMILYQHWIGHYRIHQPQGTKFVWWPYRLWNPILNVTRLTKHYSRPSATWPPVHIIHPQPSYDTLPTLGWPLLNGRASGDSFICGPYRSQIRSSDVTRQNQHSNQWYQLMDFTAVMLDIRRHRMLL